LPYFKLYKNTGALKSVWLKILFVLFGFVAGAFSENGSAAVMAMAGIIILIKIIKKEKVRIVYFLGMVTSFAGYVSMVFVPATENQGRFARVSFSGGITGCLYIFGQYLPVVAVYIIAVMILCLKKKTANIKISLLFFAGSLISLFLLAFVSFQSARRGYFSVTLMVIADLILIKDIIEIPDCRKRCLIIMCCFAVLSVLPLCFGFSDIHNTYELIKQNERHIIDCREKGQLDVEISDIQPKTKYSAVDDLQYISIYSSDTWPNDSMAKYYGVNSIIGIPVDKQSG
jgi:hypothetical protein